MRMGLATMNRLRMLVVAALGLALTNHAVTPHSSGRGTAPTIADIAHTSVHTGAGEF